MAAIGSKMGGRRKVWYTKSTGLIGDNSPNAAKEIRVNSGWTPGKNYGRRKYTVKIQTNNVRLPI